MKDIISLSSNKKAQNKTILFEKKMEVSTYEKKIDIYTIHYPHYSFGKQSIEFKQA